MKEKQYNLILRKPGEEDVLLATGSENFVETEKLNQILKNSVPSENLIIEEITEEEGTIEITFKSLIGLGFCLLGLLLLNRYGKK